MTDAISQKSRTILSCLAEGCSCDDILQMFPHYNPDDISSAAQQALTALVDPNTKLTTWREQVVEIRKIYPHAYQPWKPQDLQQLLELHRNGNDIRSIAKIIGRNPRAVEKRLRRMKTGQVLSDSQSIPRVMIQNIDQSSQT